MKRIKWKKYGFEFLSIFIAVIAAFALNNWNDNRKANVAESKILAEISNGLAKDIEDVKINISGHENGMKASRFWRDLINGEKRSLDSIGQYYFDLTRDFISIQNASGYETLKSRGLELIKDDSLRFAIISLYEYEYSVLKKFEEEYYELQFQANYFDKFNEILAPHFIYNKRGNFIGIKTPLQLSHRDKKLLMSYLWKIEINRNFMIHYFYSDVEAKIENLRQQIDAEL